LKTFFTLLLSLFGISAAFSQILFNESFDNHVFPAAGWTTRRVAPTTSTTVDLWQRISVGHSPVINTRSGAGMAFFNSYKFAGGVKTDLTTPAIDLSGPGYDSVSFWMYRDATLTSMADLVEVFINTIPGSAGGTLIATIHRSYQLNPVRSSAGWYRFSYFIPSAFNSATNYITFRGTSYNGNNIMLDDVYVVSTPGNKCHPPNNIRLTSVATSQATVVWEPAGAPEGYDWELRTNGAAGSGAAGLIASGNTVGSVTSASFNGLAANTAYQFYVRYKCSATNISIWSSAFSFTTAASLNNIPFTENFDGVTAPALPNSFTVQNVNQSTGWNNTYLGASSFSPPSYPNALVYASTTEAAGDDWLFTPALNLTAGVNYRLNFSYKSLFSGFNNQLEIKFGKVPDFQAMTSNVIYTNNNISNTSEAKAVTEFMVAETGVYYLGFHNITAAGAFNYQMLLDNIFIDHAPDPSCGLPQNITVSDVDYTTAKVKYSPAVSGSPQSYSWELRTSGLPGTTSGRISSGTAAAGTDSVLLTGLPMGTNLKFYVMTNCASPSYSTWSTASSFTTATTACNPVYNLTISNITSNSFKAAWIVPAVTSPHIGFDYEVRQSGAFGSGPTGMIQSGSTTDPFIVISGLNPNSAYFFSLKSRCASGNISSWVPYIYLATATANDDCDNAVNLNVSNGFATNLVTSTLYNSNPTTGLPISCGIMTANNTNPLKDVWFKVTIPATGNVLVETYTLNTNYRDQMMIAYSGACGNFTELACDRNSAPDDRANFNTFQARIALTNRTPGEIIYIRVLPDANPLTYNTFDIGEFGIAAWDTSASVRPAVAAAANCASSRQITINASNKNIYRWNPIFDSTGKIVAEIRPYETLGTVSANFARHDSAALRQTDTLLLLDRDIGFSSELPAGFLTAVRLYFTAAELQKIIDVLPDAELGKMKLMHVTSGCGTPIPATGQFLTPLYGNYGNDFYVEIETRNIAHFYLYMHKLLSATSIDSLRGRNSPDAIELTWQTAKETNIHRFIIERSIDSIQFQPIGQRASIATDGNSISTSYYSITDETSPKGVNYFRIKAVGKDSAITISRIYKHVFQPVSDFTLTSSAGRVKVEWKMEKEVNNKAFVIERSSDSLQFIAIDTIASAAINGNSNTTINYNVTDTQPFDGTNYYRIRQTDIYDSSNYSKVLNIFVIRPTFTIDPIQILDATSCSATLSAGIEVNAGSIDSIYFQYGISDFTHTLAASTGSIVNNAVIQDTLTGLLPASTYRVRMNFHFNDAWHYSDEINVITSPIAAPEIVLYGDSVVCEGGAVVLSSTVSHGNQWFFNDQVIDGAINEYLEADKAGKYTLMITENGCTSGHSAPVQIRTIAVPSTPVINAPDGLSVCDGKSIELNITTQQDVAYQWIRNGVVLRGADQYKCIAASGGDYHVEVINAQGCTSYSSPITVSILSSPSAPVIHAAGATGLCEGDSVMLHASDSSQWYKDGVLTQATASRSYKVTSTGNYYAVAVIGSCRSAASEGILVIVRTIPVATISTTTDTIFCDGGKVLLQASRADGNRYQWWKDTDTIPNATLSTYEANSTGSYKVTVTNSSCVNTSASKPVLVKSLPAKPVIQVTNNTLTSSATTGNQWFLNGVSIAGATNKDYTVKESGNYAVEVTVNDCKNRSEAFNFVATAVVDPQTFSDITVYPNPVRENLVIKNTAARKLNIRLTDAYGRIIFQETIQAQETTINTKAIIPGNYMLIITDLTKKQTVSRKLIKI
jgi:hypothetical protein